MKQGPLWLFEINKPKALLVVAHADDETIFAGGLILSSVNTIWTIVCANPQGKERKEEFLEACRFYTKKAGINIVPVLLEPVLDENEIIDSDWLSNELKQYRMGYDFVLTHNKEGEYGHDDHRVVHNCVLESIANPNTWFFISPGSTNVNQEILKSMHQKGNVVLILAPEIQRLKKQAFACHQSQARMYGYDSFSKKLKETDLRETLQWEFESGEERYTFHI